MFSVGLVVRLCVYDCEKIRYKEGMTNDDEDDRNEQVSDNEEFERDILSLNSKKWKMVGKEPILSANNMGISVECNNNGTIVAMSSYEGPSSGVFVYRYNDTVSSWNQMGQFLPTDYDGARTWTSLSEDGAIVAMSHKFLEVYSLTRVFRFSAPDGSPASSSWIQLGQNITHHFPTALFGVNENDQFETKVALSGDGTTLAIGLLTSHAMPLSNSTSENEKIGSHVRIYRLDNVTGTWQPLGKNPILFGNTYRNFDVDDRFGDSLTLTSDGRRIGIGATYTVRIIQTSIGNNVNVTTHTGSAQVYELNSETNEWNQLGQTIMGLRQSDKFGQYSSISLDGTVFAVSGATNSNDVGGTDSGHVQIYRLTNRQPKGSQEGTQVREEWEWVQMSGDLYGDNPYDALGHSIALSGNGKRVAVGAKGVDYPNVGGYARVFEFVTYRNSGGDDRLSDGNWAQVGEDDFVKVQDETSGFGTSVALSEDGTVAVVSSPFGQGLTPGGGYIKVYQEFSK